MTRYRVPVADPLLLEQDYWQPVEGFRLISIDGPWLTHPACTICTFEDDNAPAELEDKLVEPYFVEHRDEGQLINVTIAGRNVIA